MTEKELGKALLNLDAAAHPAGSDPRVLTARILERDRRRVRLWTGVTIGTWLLAAALVLLVLVTFGFLMPMQAKLQGDEWKGRVTPVEREQLLHTLELGFKKGMVTTTLSVGILSLAALCTVFLVLASRRATLRQVNANLAEISDQLKQLRQVLAK